MDIDAQLYRAMGDTVIRKTKKKVDNGRIRRLTDKLIDWLKRHKNGKTRTDRQSGKKTVVRGKRLMSSQTRKDEKSPANKWSAR